MNSNNFFTAATTLVLLACILVQEARGQINGNGNGNSNSLRDQYEEYQIRGRDLANLYRAKHDSPPLKLNETLNKAAQAFADSLIRTSSFRNKLEPGFIKNLYEFKGIEIEPNQAVEGAIKTWYGSEKKYNWAKPDISAFSALVWKASTDLGIGVASRGVRTVVVAAFSPEGNLLGEGGKYFRDNVQRARS